jgi:pimeloyl-ACP methyl ester carboxylesterase
MSEPRWKRNEIERLEAGSQVVATARGSIEYSEVGTGPVILTLHGRPGGYDQGLLIARLLGEDLARWVYVSRPGYLRTPQDVGCTPSDQADAYAALLDALGITQAVVLGISGGGPSALQFALRHPERCRGLVLISAVTRRKTTKERPAAQRFYDSVLAPSDRLSWLVYRLLGPIAGTLGKQVMATALVLPESLRGAGRRNDIAQFEALPEAPPPGIHVPTLIVHGTADRIVPIEHAEAAARAIPGSRMFLVTGGGHNIFFVRAAAIRPELLRFLKSLPPDS